MNFKIGDTVVPAAREDTAVHTPVEDIGVVSRLDGPDFVHVSWAERGERISVSRLVADRQRHRQYSCQTQKPQLPRCKVRPPNYHEKYANSTKIRSLTASMIRPTSEAYRPQ